MSSSSLMSFSRMTAALCGALSILLALVVLTGWTIHSSVLVRVAPGLPPMRGAAAIGFLLSGLALLGTAFNRPRLTFIGSLLAALLAAASLLSSRMSPAAAFCFIVLAAGLVVAENSPLLRRSQILGIAGAVVGTIAAACGISVIWGSGGAFGLGAVTHMGFPTSAGFLILALGAVAVGVDISLAEFRQPLWASIGGSIFLLVVRIELLRAFSPERQSGISSALAFAGATIGAFVFGFFAHLALKAHLQGRLLLKAERATHLANEQLELRVEERTRAVEATNEELREEIARRERVDADLRQQQEILQSIVDHVPLILKFVDKDGRIQMVNREWVRVLGRTLDEIVNRGVDIYSEGYPDPAERQRILHFVATSNAEWADFKTRVKDGRVIDTSWAVVRLSDGATVCIGQDISERKQAEQELLRQKSILQTIFDHIPVMINFGDSNYGLNLVNREWERTLGWSLEEIRRDNVDMLKENYPDPQYRERVRHFVRNSEGEWGDFKTKVRDGRIIDTSWVMLHLADGTTMGIGQDITRRKRAEEALRESEERFRQLAENIHDLFWIKTPDFKRVLYLSPVYERMSGRSVEERYQDTDYESFLKTIHPEDRESMERVMTSGEGKEFDIEFRILRADGSTRWIRDRGFPIRDQSGQVYRIAGIANDITERKLAEEALRESEERFRQLADNIREVFWLRSPDFKQLLYVSPMYEKVCGRSTESFYAAGPDFAGLHPEDRPWLNELAPTLAGIEFEIEYRIVTLTGEVRWLRDRGFPIRNAAGEVYRIGGVAEDITDRKEAADRLKASSEQLRALSANLQSAREQEAARIAHQIHDDMGGVLTGLRWELEAMKKMIDEPTDSWPSKAVMQEKLATMLGLTDTTINVVRRIASELRPSILDDLGLMEAVEWQTQQFQARTGIECRCDCTLPGVPLGEVESTAVFRIVQEALTNIIRHAQATQVRVTMTVEHEVFTISVNDNGRGISQEEILSRASLGLLGMQERAHLIGGRVEIAGVPDAGTTLYVRVPLAKVESAGAK
jgi:PAS domain S-box-containing protein